MHPGVSWCDFRERGDLQRQIGHELFEKVGDHKVYENHQLCSFFVIFSEKNKLQMITNWVSRFGAHVTGDTRCGLVDEVGPFFGKVTKNTHFKHFYQTKLLFSSPPKTV